MEFPCILALFISPVILSIGLLAKRTALRSRISLLIQLFLTDFVELLFQPRLFNSSLNSQRSFSQSGSIHRLDSFEHICINKCITLFVCESDVANANALEGVLVFDDSHVDDLSDCGEMCAYFFFFDVKRKVANEDGGFIV